MLLRLWTILICKLQMALYSQLYKKRKGEEVMKAIWKDKVIAEADKDQLIYIEGNWYFPPSSVKAEHLRESPTPYTCPWKGVCQYFDVGEGEDWSKDTAFSYPKPLPGALDIVKKDFANYVAFYRDIKVTD